VLDTPRALLETRDSCGPNSLGCATLRKAVCLGKHLTMSLANIVWSVLGSMGLLTLAAVAIRTFVKASIEKGIQYRLDAALESVRSE
jgi:hypothetical protein